MCTHVSWLLVVGRLVVFVVRYERKLDSPKLHQLSPNTLQQHHHHQHNINPDTCQTTTTFAQVLENMCAILGREDGEAGEAAGLRAMAAVLLRTLFDVRSDVWFRVE